LVSILRAPQSASRKHLRVGREATSKGQRGQAFQASKACANGLKAEDIAGDWVRINNVTVGFLLRYDTMALGSGNWVDTPPSTPGGVLTGSDGGIVELDVNAGPEYFVTTWSPLGLGSYASNNPIAAPSEGPPLEPIVVTAQKPKGNPKSVCANATTAFYGAQLTVIPGVGGQASAGNYSSSNGSKGSFVSFGGGVGINFGFDAFAGFVNGGPNVLRGRTDAVTLGLGPISLNLIFKPDSAFNSSTFLGAAVGPGGDLGLSFSKDNTFLISPTNPNGC
jgi:hypothetical protein